MELTKVPLHMKLPRCNLLTAEMDDVTEIGAWIKEDGY
jgi:hypothetical protein